MQLPNKILLSAGTTVKLSTDTIGQSFQPDLMRGQKSCVAGLARWSLHQEQQIPVVWSAGSVRGSFLSRYSYPLGRPRCWLENQQLDPGEISSAYWLSSIFVDPFRHRRYWGMIARDMLASRHWAEYWLWPIRRTVLVGRDRWRTVSKRGEHGESRTRCVWWNTRWTGKPKSLGLEHWTALQEQQPAKL